MPEDEIIIFIATHGHYRPDKKGILTNNKVGYIIPYDANIDTLGITAWDMHEFINSVSQIKAHKILLILDCCYSGQTIENLIFDPQIWGQFIRGGLTDLPDFCRAVLASCLSPEETVEINDLKHGAFSFCILEGLRGEANPSELDWVTLTYLQSYIRQSYPRIRRKFNLQLRQNPLMVFIGTADFQLTQVKKWRGYLPPLPKGEIIPRTEFLQNLLPILLRSNMRIVNVHGLRGSGKSHVTLRFAHLCKERGYFDRIFWFDMQPQSVTLMDLMHDISFHMNRETRTETELPELRSFLELIFGDRLLLIIDNYYNVAENSSVKDKHEAWQNFFLFHLPQNTKVILVTHHALSYAYTASLEGMNFDEAKRFLFWEWRRLKISDTIGRLTDAQLQEIHELTTGLPLLLMLYAALLRHMPAAGACLTISDALGETEAPLAYKSVYDQLFRYLSDQEKKCLQSIAFLNIESPVSLSAIGAIAAEPITEQELEKVPLIEILSGDENDDARRYSIHGVTQEYFLHQLRNSGQEEEFGDRAAQYFLTFVEANIDDMKDGYRKIDKEILQIIHVMSWCYERQKYEIVLRYLEQISYYLWDRNHHDLRTQWAQKGIVAAKKLAQNDRRYFWQAGKCAYWLAWYYCRRDDLEESDRFAEQANKFFRKAKPEVDEEPRILQLRGMIAHYRKKYDEAERYFLEALEKFEQEIEIAGNNAQQLNKRFWAVTVKTNLGDLYKAQGNIQQSQEEKMRYYLKAKKVYQEVLETANRQCCDSNGNVIKFDIWAARRARSMGNLGDIHRRLGQDSKAREYYEVGLDLACDMGLKYTIAACKLGLGLIWEKDGERERASEYFREAFQIIATEMRADTERDEMERIRREYGI
ncbi:MAG: hypothetical protein D6732_27745 [Methanobacteriota archaeon]|nr:MAG: hypothetical protein D6732_27745 [Euryarchaeota archaeon]